MKLFNRKNEINPFPVSDMVTFRNVDKTITLYVRSDAPSIVLGVKNSVDRLSSLSDESSENEQIDAALRYAEVIFGKEQAEALLDFYDKKALAVITACGMYFQNRLSKLITKAQKL